VPSLITIAGRDQVEPLVGFDVGLGHTHAVHVLHNVLQRISEKWWLS